MAIYYGNTLEKLSKDIEKTKDKFEIIDEFYVTLKFINQLEGISTGQIMHNCSLLGYKIDSIMEVPLTFYEIHTHERETSLEDKVRILWSDRK